MAIYTCPTTAEGHASPPFLGAFAISDPIKSTLRQKDISINIGERYQCH